MRLKFKVVYIQYVRNKRYTYIFRNQYISIYRKDVHYTKIPACKDKASIFLVPHLCCQSCGASKRAFGGCADMPCLFPS